MCMPTPMLASPGKYVGLRTQSLLPIAKLSLLQLFKHSDFTCLPFDMGEFTCVVLGIKRMEERARRTVASILSSLSKQQ